MPNKKELKRLYDIEYRRKNKKKIEEKKSAYYQTEAGKATAKRNRVRMASRHAEYCRTLKYKKYKRNYDTIHLAIKRYGEYWECMILVEKIHKEILKLVPDKYERDKIKGTVDRMQAKQALKRHIEKGWNFNWAHVLSLSNH